MNDETPDGKLTDGHSPMSAAPNYNAGKAKRRSIPMDIYERAVEDAEKASSDALAQLRRLEMECGELVRALAATQAKLDLAWRVHEDRENYLRHLVFPS